MAANIQELSSDNLALVLEELFTVPDKWYNIGLCLGLRSVILDGIQSENQKKEENCLRDMLNKRINQGGLTWEKIAEALGNLTVDRSGVANEIRAKYCTPVATQTVIGSPTATIPPSSTNPANLTAGPSNPSGSDPHNSDTSSAILTLVPPKKTKPGPGKRPLDAPLAGPSKRSKKTKAEFYSEEIFVSKNTLQKYRCTRCKQVPKQCYRCRCSGLSCSDCKNKACFACKKKDQYERDKATDNSIRGLLVFCEKKCGAKLLLRALDQHLNNECPKRRRPCTYSWVGCKFVGDGDTEEMRLHEEDITVHFVPAMSTIHSLFDELQQRIDTVETWGTKQLQKDPQ